MLRTKLARKVLTKTEQKHLTEMNIHSMEQFKETRKYQIERDEESREKGNTIRCCFDCNHIARKLGIE